MTRRKTAALNFIYCLMIVIAALFTTGFRQAADNIATVSGDPITVTQFQQRVRLARFITANQLRQMAQVYGPESFTASDGPFNPQYKSIVDTTGFARQVLDSLITLKLVQHEANTRGIIVSDEDTQNQIYTFFGFNPNAPVPTAAPDQPPIDPTQIAEGFQANVDNYFGAAGVTAHMTQADVIGTFAEQALQVKIFEAVTSSVPTDAEQTRVRHILVDNEAAANALLVQIQGGVPFADMAKANSLDTSSAAQGGDLGWAARGSYDAALDAAIWAAHAGALIGPIKSQFGYHLVLIEDRGVRPLSAGDLARARDAVYKQWLEETRKSADVQIVEKWQSFIPEDPTLADLGLPQPQ
jgi:parvulin-like peptidyl-prolyl isomerase